MALFVYEGFDNWSASFVSQTNLSGLVGTGPMASSGIPGLWNLVGSFSASVYGGRAINTSNTGSWSFDTRLANTSALITGFRWASNPLSNNVITIFDSAGAVQCGLSVSASKLFMWRGTTATVLGTGTTTIIAGFENYIEIKTQLSNSANVTVKINGVVEFTLTGVDTTNTANQDWRAVGQTSSAGGGVLTYDDFYLEDDTGPAPFNDFLGPVHVDTSFVTSAVSTQFTPLTSTNVSQVQDSGGVDGDTTYNFTSFPGLFDSFLHNWFTNSTALSSTPQTIFAAKLQSFARKDDTFYRAFFNRLVSSNGQVTFGSVRPGGLTTVYQLQEDYFLTDPATGLSWTLAGINGTQIGYGLGGPTAFFLGAGSLTVNATTVSPSVAVWDNLSSGPGILLSGGNLIATEGTNRITSAFAVDLTNKLYWFRSKNTGLWNGTTTANPATGVGGKAYSVTGALFPAWSGFDGAGGDQTTAHFSAASLTRNPPNGFSAWDTLVSATTTWNPSDKDAAITLSNGNLTAAQDTAAGAWRTVRATTSASSGKGYFEITTDRIDASQGFMPGMGNATASLTTFIGATANGFGVQSNGTAWENSASTPAFTDAFADASADSIWKSVRATVGQTSGKRCFEITLTALDAAHVTGVMVGIMDVNGPGQVSTGQYIGTDTHGVSWQTLTNVPANSGDIWFNASSGTSLVNNKWNTQGTTVMAAVDFTNSKVWFWNPLNSKWNGDVIGSQNPATNTGGQSISTFSGLVFPALALFYNSGTPTSVTANFGASAFVNTVPSGFSIWG